MCIIPFVSVTMTLVGNMCAFGREHRAKIKL